MFYMRSFADELTKIATMARSIGFLRESVVPVARKHGGKAALVAAGGAGALGIKRLADDVAFAEKARSQGYEF